MSAGLGSISVYGQLQLDSQPPGLDKHHCNNKKKVKARLKEYAGETFQITTVYLVPDYWKRKAVSISTKVLAVLLFALQQVCEAAGVCAYVSAGCRPASALKKKTGEESLTPSRIKTESSINSPVTQF